MTLIRDTSRRISVRLRLGFVVIALLTSAAAMISINQATAVQNANRTLNQVGMPMYRLAQEVEGDLKIMLRQLEDLGRSQTRNEIIATERRIRETAQDLKRDLHRFEALRGDGAQQSNLSQQIEAAENALISDVSDHLRKHELDMTLIEARARISDTLRQQRQTLSKLSFDMADQTESYIQQVAVKTPVTVLDVEHLFSNLFLNSINLDAMGQALETLENGLGVLTPQADAQTAAEQERLVTRKLQYIVGRLASLPPGPDRLTMARHTATLRGAFLGPEGLFERLSARRSFVQDMQANLARQNLLIEELQDRMLQMVSATLRGVGQSADRLNTEVQRTVFVISLGFLAIIVTILLISQSIVENQFTRRISALTHSVSAIAAGQLDHPIKVKGQDELGEMARALAVFRENARDLRRSNVELEKFAYVAAHDLRAPLTAIADLGNWVAEDQDNRLSASSLAYLCLLGQRTQRLKKLLHDLLDYARVGADADTPQFVDLDVMTRELAAQCDPESRFQVLHRGLRLPVYAPETALRQICANLIENAIKHHDRETGLILLETTVRAKTLVLSLSDDGPGIEPKHQTRVFELFQTLKPRDEVEGSGLGLAIVAKLAARHNGTVCIHSNPEQQRGTTFEVCLPLRAPPVGVPDTPPSPSQPKASA